jgi:molybdopterin biosynthesis enzyme
LTCIKVFKRPRVAVISTGNELVSPGTPLEYGKIYDINSRTIADSVIECGGIPKFLGIARDDKGERLPEAAVREIKEETSLTLDENDLTFIGHYDYEKKYSTHSH